MSLESKTIEQLKSESEAIDAELERRVNLVAEGTDYWIVNFFTEEHIKKHQWSGQLFDLMQKELNNFFFSESAAQEAAQKIKELLKTLRK